ncbi:MAG: ABC transporter ATP-binding protein [Lachnospira sp.]|nr:ABC transporter ATP-binding protein [Lachnospira sp.]
MSLDYSAENAIEIKELNKSYKGFSLKDVSFNVPSGCVTGFIGQNGAGKSTTIKAILNMLKRDSGDIKVFGADNIENEFDIKENIGVVFDDIGFHPNLKPKHIDKILKGMYKNWDSKVFFEYLEKLDLPLKKKVGQYSRGMQMKLQIATALSHHAKLLIMDEPTGGLDPIVRNEILDIFMEFIQDSEHTVFLSSHIITDLERIADHIVFIHKGKVLLSEEKDIIAERHGILKCSKEQFDSVDMTDVIGYRKSSFGIEALVGDREKCAIKYKGMLCEKTTLEEIMLFYVNNSKE